MGLEGTQNIYSLPVPRDAITAIVKDNFSHRGPYKGAIDFAVPINTPVFAAHTRVVSRTNDNIEQWGLEEKYGPLVNYVTIKHENGELSEYLHLAKGSIHVRVGDNVEQGQIIAATDLSGRMTEPHLHFIVYKYTDLSEGFAGLSIRFNQRLPKS